MVKSIRKKLNEYISTNSGSIEIKILNGGLSGSDPIPEYFILVKLLLKYIQVSTYFHINMPDITDVIKLGGFDRYTNYVEGPWWNFIYQFSYISRAIIHGSPDELASS